MIHMLVWIHQYYQSILLVTLSKVCENVTVMQMWCSYSQIIYYNQLIIVYLKL